MKVGDNKLPLHHHTRAGQHRFREFVSDCGGTYAASVKLGVSSFFIDQILRDEPVPDHILDGIEEAIGPLRIPEHSSGFLNESSPEKPGNLLKAEVESELTLKEFVTNSGGLLAASHKLGVSTMTMKKMLAGVPLSGPTIKKVVNALKERDYSIVSDTPNSSPSNQHTLPEISRLLESPTYLRGVYPSTVRKLQRGQPISKPTQSKLGISSEAQTTLRTPDHSRTDSITALSSRLREIIKSDVDMFDLASKLGVAEGSLRKIYGAKPVTRALAEKVAAALEVFNTTHLLNKPSSAIERLRKIQYLYEQLGSLEAVGAQVGLTRERVRQLLSKGKKIGLFDYSPREYPYLSKEKIIEDYKNTQSINRVARLNKISTGYLDKLLTAYSITEQDLADYRLEGKRARCIEQFEGFTKSMGHNPTSTELQRTGNGRALYNRITRFWGSINNFRSELSIPKPSHIRPHWLDPWRQIKLVKRMQDLDTLRDCMSTSSPVGVSELCQKSNFSPNRVRSLLALLMATGEVKRIGQLANTKYLLARN